MIPVYQIFSNNDKFLSHEQLVARRMGESPLPVEKIDASKEVKDFLKLVDTDQVVLIYDPEFWYPYECWSNWVKAVSKQPENRMISLPLGNQNPEWRVGLDIPLYFTVNGLEKASCFKADKDWAVTEVKDEQELCVFVIPKTILAQIPPGMQLWALPGFVLNRKIKARVYCHGWLHSFNALGDAGCRYDLIRMTTWHGKVLEFGCGKGLMARACKEMGNHVTWVGVDLDHKSVNHARQYVDLAVMADAGCELPFRRESKFDRAVCGDFLEHLAYPWIFLEQLKSMMTEDGLLLASVPNLGHWSVLEDLISGRFDEAPSGTLCVTHLRFGTKSSWQRWLVQAGWKIVRWEEERFALPEKWQRLNRIRGFSIDQDSLETIRYRIVAKAGCARNPVKEKDT